MLCEVCGIIEAINKERFCKDCKKAKISEMKEAGYLQRVPGPARTHRTSEMKEDINETKRGADRF